jgi:hypothetical protein
VIAPDESPDVLYMETTRGRELPHLPENMAMRGEILEVVLREGCEFDVHPVPVRPIPDDDSWYENTWREWMSESAYLDA